VTKPCRFPRLFPHQLSSKHSSYRLRAVYVQVLSAFGGKLAGGVTESGQPVWADGKFVSGVAGVTAGTSDGKDFTFSVGSGRYSFVVSTPNDSV